MTIVVAIDGPAGSGKGTIARNISKKYDFPHLDSGSLYRGVAASVLEIGKKKIDELLFIRDSEIVTYFSFHRSGEKGKMIWQFGDGNIAESIVQDILKVQNEKYKKLTSVGQVFIYTSDGNVKDVKSFHQLKIENLTLLNPLSVLESTKDEKIHEYNTLPLAETGNAFGGVDV